MDENSFFLRIYKRITKNLCSSSLFEAAKRTVRNSIPKKATSRLMEKGKLELEKVSVLEKPYFKESRIVNYTSRIWEDTGYGFVQSNKSSNLMKNLRKKARASWQKKTNLFLATTSIAIVGYAIAAIAFGNGLTFFGVANLLIIEVVAIAVHRKLAEKKEIKESFFVRQVKRLWNLV